MLKPLWIFCITVFLTLGVFFWWFNQWMQPIYLTSQVVDYEWRKVEKKDASYERSALQSGQTGEYWSYQSGGILLYGHGERPTISRDKNTEIGIPPESQWIISSLDSTEEILIKSADVSLVLHGIGAVYIDSSNNRIANFDAHVTLADSSELLPSFIREKNISSWFDTSGDDAIQSDLWQLYMAFFPVDQKRVLGSVTKKDLDNYLTQLIQREPEKSDELFHYDLRIRSALEQIQLITTQIANGEKCGADYSDCSKLLESTLMTNIRFFPEVFLPVKNAVDTWLAIDTDSRKNAWSWYDIYATYHAGMIADRPDARAVRDKRILQMIQSSVSDTSLASWTYLTQMIGHEKTGSVYLLQLMREMVRIGNKLLASPPTGTTADQLKKTASGTLVNLKDLLQNTYFIQKDYWFELRRDLVDSEGIPIIPTDLVSDLENLITDVNNSQLFVSDDPAAQREKRVIASQLTWFQCIMSKNAEYVANPRICRATITK